MDFEQQAARIKHYCDCYNVVRMTVDKTGMGEGVYQLVSKFFPTVQGLSYNLDVKNEMVLKTLNIIQKRRFEFDQGDKDIITSFMTIKKQVTKSGRQITYISDRSEEASHGDIAWAIMSCFINEPYDAKTNTSARIIEFH